MADTPAKKNQRSAPAAKGGAKSAHSASAKVPAATAGGASGTSAASGATAASGASAALRLLPKVDELILAPECAAWIRDFSRIETLDAVRAAIDRCRKELLAGNGSAPAAEAALKQRVLALAGDALAARKRLRIQKVVNASGVILHTGLGRAMLPAAALERLRRMDGYVNLEFDVASNERNFREGFVADLLCKLTGAQAATVVNNNAAAVLLILSTFAQGREAVVSRGELVEIGGSFRVPDVMKQAGARMVEIGTTNKTKPSDYEKACNANTGVLMKIHTSNFRVVGFTQAVTLKELAAIGKKHNVVVAEDLGSGALYDPRDFGLSGEPLVQQSLAAGIDVICFSGDKLLGGPQSGILCGTRDAIHRLRSNPLFRALRVDKLTLAALEATVQLYLRPETLAQELPTLRMLSLKIPELEKRGHTILRALKKTASFSAALADTHTEIGSGSLPLEQLASKAIELTPAARSADDLARALRLHTTPVIPRIDKGKVYLDLRTVQPVEDAILIDALNSLK